MIDLPSKGKVYPESNPLSKGSIEIKYMTAKEEDILISTKFDKEGVGLDKLFESIVVDKDVDINDIVVGDKNDQFSNYSCSRIWCEYQVEITDPFTDEQQPTTIDLSKIQTKEVDFDKLNRENLYEFELPKTKKKIKFKLLTHKDETDINTEVDTSITKITKGKSDVSTDVTTRLKYMIQEVDGKTDRGFINSFVVNDFINLGYKDH